MTINVDQLADALGIGYYILVYGIGALAMAFSILAFQCKHRVAIILGNFFGQSCWVVHFVLQGDLTSAIACALSAAMLAVFSRSNEWKWAIHPVSIAFFIILLAGFSLLSFKDWTDIFPVMAGIFAVIANSRKTEKRLRQFSVAWCLSWLMNSICKGYPIAFANDALCTGSAIVSLIRYRDKVVEK